MDKTIVSNRRTAMKALAAAAGAVTISTLPTRWSKPSVMVGAVPAHAQVSICVDWSVIVQLTSQIDGGATLFDYDPNYDDNPSFGFYYWACEPGCLWIRLGNDGESGQTAMTVTIFGTEIPVGPFGPGEEIWFVINRTTGVWESNSDPNLINWGGIECRAPLLQV